MNFAIKLNGKDKKSIRIILLLFIISFLLSIIYGFTFNKIFAGELGAKYACFRYDHVESCGISKYIHNSVLIFPKHLLIEVPIGMLVNPGSIIDEFTRLGLIASLIVLYHFTVIAWAIIKIVKIYKSN